jgi:hypothetical protein
MRWTASILAIAAMIVGCQDTSAPVAPDDAASARGTVSLALKAHAEMEFGSEHVGSPFPPAQHDQSFRAFDKVRPRVVVIARGGSVTFEVYPCHQPAVYSPGTTPDDIDIGALEASAAGCPPQRINDPVNRVALGPPTAAPGAGANEWTTPPGTFDVPGRYLVICTTLVHFQFAKMYAWVDVK